MVAYGYLMLPPWNVGIQEFPAMKQLEEPDHPRRQEIAFARQVADQRDGEMR